jgi:hypothetical protein
MQDDVGVMRADATVQRERKSTAGLRVAREERSRSEKGEIERGRVRFD